MIVGGYQGFFIFHTDAESIPYDAEQVGECVRISAECAKKCVKFLITSDCVKNVWKDPLI
jgi:hypothetical protein